MEPFDAQARSEWVEAVPALLARCVERWGLRIDGPLQGGYWAHVFACTDGEGDQFVLKLSPPDANPGLEAAALRLWSGHAVPSLKSWDPEAGAILLDRIIPGTPLPPGHEEDAIRAAAAVLRELHSVPIPERPPFPPLPEAFDSYLAWVRTEADPNAAGVPLIERAHAAARRLWSTAQETVLLHGDFIDKNLLLGPAGYLAIDPMPRTGDPCSDIGCFASYHPPAGGIGTVARALALALGHDPSRAARWAAVWSVGEACETWREDSDELQEWIISKEASDLLSS